MNDPRQHTAPAGTVSAIRAVDIGATTAQRPLRAIRK